MLQLKRGASGTAARMRIWQATNTDLVVQVELFACIHVYMEWVTCLRLHPHPPLSKSRLRIDDVN